MTDYELAWAAGLIDGDGSLAIHENRQRHHHYGAIIVPSTHLPTLEHIQGLVGAGSIQRRGKRKDHHKEQHCYVLLSDGAVQLARQIEPHLFIKRDQCRALLQFGDTVGGLGMMEPLPDSVLEHRRQLSAQVSALRIADGQDNLGSSGSVELTGWAWLAGLFDAEGSIQIEARRGGRDHVLHVGIQMAHKAAIYRILAITGTGSVCEPRRGQAWEWMPYWMWQAKSALAEAALTGMLPYLITKKEQAELALAFRSTQSATKKPRPTPPQVIAAREVYRKQLQQLKR